MRTWLMVSALLFCRPAIAADSAQLAQILAYQGVWRTDFRDLATPYSKAGETHAMVANDCHLTAAFVTCAQSVDGKPVALIVYVPGQGPSDFKTTAVTPDGAANPGGALHIEGPLWTYPWTEVRDGKTIRVRIENRFLRANEIAFAKSYSEDGVSWTPMSVGTEHRVP